MQRRRNDRGGIIEQARPLYVTGCKKKVTFVAIVCFDGTAHAAQASAVIGRSADVVHRSVFTVLFAVALTASAAAPAGADGPFSLSVGPAIMFQSAARQVGGTSQINVGAALDVGAAKPFPLRNSFLFDYASGSANGGSLTDWGIGFGTRLSTPAYLGAGAFYYSVNVKQGPIIGSRSTGGFGSNIFVGEKLIDVPGGAAVGAQITYRQLPTLDGIDPSGLAFTLRVSL
jgi:hypothetical protein